MLKRRKLDDNTEEIILFPGDPPETIEFNSFFVMAEVIQGKGMLRNLDSGKKYSLPLKSRMPRIHSSRFILFNPPENKKFLSVLITTLRNF